MKEIRGINHFGIRVKNLGTARNFYPLLGFEFLDGPLGPEPVAIMEHPSGININLILNTHLNCTYNVLMNVTEKYPGYTHIALDVTDIKAIEASLISLGIAITDGPITLPNGGVMLFIRDQDQDRNVIEFHQNG